MGEAEKARAQAERRVYAANRRAEGVTFRAIAAEMGVHPTRVSELNEKYHRHVGWLIRMGWLRLDDRWKRLE